MNTAITKKRHLKKASLFVGLTFFFNYSLIILYIASGGKWGSPSSFIVSIIYMLIPATTAIIVQKIIYFEPIKKLGISFKPNWWLLAAWLLPAVIVLTTLGISLTFPGIQYSPEMAGLFEKLQFQLPPEDLQQVKTQIANLPIHPFWLGLVGGLIAGVTINAIAGFGEELGWRGLLQKELNFMGFWKSSAIIGIIWGIWHAPIILLGHNYPQHPVIGVLMMTIFTLLFSPVFTYITIKAKSAIAAAIMHGTLNGTAGLSTLVIKGGNDLTVGVSGLAGFIAITIVIIALITYDRLLAKEPIIVR